MGQLPKIVNFSSKLVLQILPSISATVIGGYLLAQIHVGRNPEPPPPQIVVSAPPDTHEAAHDVPTVREDRDAMRKVLKERRENPQAPAVVRPIPHARPAAAAANETPSAPPAAAADSPPPAEPVERAAAPSRPKPAVAAAPPRHDADPSAQANAGADYVPAPPPGLPPAPATAMNAPMPIVRPPVAPAAQPLAPPRLGPPPMMPATPPMASAVPPPPPTTPPPAPPPSNGPVGTVFSALSSIVGHAANATGSTVNWVIDLPGKAISAGGRVINGSPSQPAPARYSDGGEG